jgi:hypothetical protein
MTVEELLKHKDDTDDIDAIIAHSMQQQQVPGAKRTQLSSKILQDN